MIETSRIGVPVIKPKRPTRYGARAIQYAVIGLGVLLFAVIMIGPFLWIVVTSFKTADDVLAYPPTWIPEPATLDNYREVFEQAPFDRFLLNSVIVATVVTISSCFTSSLAGYAFAKFEFLGREVLFLIVLSTLMIPWPVVVIPLYVMIQRLGLLDTYWALVLPGLVSPFGIFMMRQFIRTIPPDLIDAARLDGASEIGIYSRIILPLSKPALAALGILIFITNWDSFLWPVVVTNSVEMRTLPVGLSMFQAQFGVQWHLVTAGIVISALPLFIVYLVFQKQIIEGIALTGMKG